MMMATIIPYKNNKLLNDISMSSDTETTLCCKVDFDKVFDKPCFLERLRIEKHRAQRSNNALSLIVLSNIKSVDSDDATSISKLLKTIYNHVRETDIVGYVDECTVGVLLPYTGKEGAKVIGEKIAAVHNGSNIVVSVTTYPDQIFESLADHGCVSVNVLKQLLEDTINHSNIKLSIKRVVDVVGSILGMLVLSPIMLIAAICIKANSPGPIIFIQTRIGRQGVPFKFYKFRSMQADTSDQIHKDYVFKLIDGNHALINNGDEASPLYKIKLDPRITGVGKFIRKTSIDELPQLFNVLKGDMSLVGPRPPLAYEAAKYQAWHLRRILDMKPGLTGLWQVEGRSRTAFDEAVRLDLRYLQTWTLILDFKIIVKTVNEVLQCRGAV